MPPGHVFDFRMLYTLPHVEAIESSIPDAGAGLGTKKAFSEGEVVVHMEHQTAVDEEVQSCVEMRESCLPYVHAMCLPCPSHVSAAPSCAFRNDHALESS